MTTKCNMWCWARKETTGEVCLRSTDYMTIPDRHKFSGPHWQCPWLRKTLTSGWRVYGKASYSLWQHFYVWNCLQRGKTHRSRVFSLVRPSLLLSLIICTRLRNSTTWCYLSLSFLRLLRSINWNISLMRLVSSVLVLEQEVSCTGVKYALNPRLLAQCLARLWMNEWFKKIYYGKIDKETRTWSIPDSVTLSGFRIREQKIRLTFRKQLCFNSLIFFDFSICTEPFHPEHSSFLKINNNVTSSKLTFI